MLKVIKSGFYTSVQDAGRFGHRAYGVPVSGAMDMYSHNLANALLGNSNSCATLEITMVGPVLQFFKPTRIVVSGANMNAQLNSEFIEMNSVILVKANDVLSFGKLEKGFRSYLAIKGGFLSEQIFESRSMFKNITESTHLLKGDVIDYLSEKKVYEDSNANIRFDNLILDSGCLEVYKGPEYNKLTQNQKDLLLSSDFKVSKLNNRMAYQLESLIENSIDPILTSPVLPGTIQLTPSGKLIVLMRDCQTTGGYPRILQLSEKSINCLSQKTTGNCLKIRLKD